MSKAKFSDFGLDVTRNFLHAKRCENGNECLMYADNKADAIVKGCCEIIRDSAENPRPTKSLGDECAATGLFRYPSMERMQLYI